MPPAERNPQNVIFSIWNILVKCYLCGTVTAADVLGSPLPGQLDEMTSYTWIEALIVNSLGYASVIIPGFLIIKYLKQSHYLERHGMLSTVTSTV